MPQDRIEDLKKKRQREKEMDAIESSISSKDNAAYKSARERVAKGPNMSDNKKGTIEGQAVPSGQARFSSSNKGLSRLSAQSANYSQQPIYKRPDKPLANTPEPKMY